MPAAHLGLQAATLPKCDLLPFGHCLWTLENPSQVCQNSTCQRKACQWQYAEHQKLCHTADEALSDSWSILLQDDDMRIGHIGNRHKSGKLPEDSAAGHDLEAARLNSLNNGTEAGKPVTHARAPGHAHGPSVEAGMPVTHVPHFQTVV